LNIDYTTVLSESMQGLYGVNRVYGLVKSLQMVILGHFQSLVGLKFNKTQTEDGQLN
jgi:hypothetical protein